MIIEIKDDSPYQKLIRFFDSPPVKKLILECHYVIIERQLAENYRAVRISQHTITYFLVQLKNSTLNPIIIELDSKVKGGQLGGAMGLSSKQLKAWAVEKAISILTMRNDSFSLDILNKIKKKDDLADCVVQLDALCSMWKLPPYGIINPASNPFQIIVPNIPTAGNEKLPESKITLNMTSKIEVKISSIGSKTATTITDPISHFFSLIGIPKK